MENLLLASGTERKKGKFEDSQQEGVRSIQEVGLRHSSDEVSVMEMEPRAWVISVNRQLVNSQRG